MHEFFSTELQTKQTRERVDANAMMMQATLHDIASAGFGVCTHWSAFDEHDGIRGWPAQQREDDDVLPFHTALHLATDNLFLHVLAPKFLDTLPLTIPWLSKQLTTTRRAFSSLEKSMQRLISASTLEKNATLDLRHRDESPRSSAQADLLRRLVQANEASHAANLDDGLPARKSLTDDELLSNVFVSFRPTSFVLLPTYEALQMFFLAGHGELIYRDYI